MAFSRVKVFCKQLLRSLMCGVSTTKAHLLRYEQHVLYLWHFGTDPGGTKTYGSHGCGSGYGSGFRTQQVRNKRNL
jgi:hypothetical protein